MRNMLLVAVFLLSGCAVADLRAGRAQGDFSVNDQNKGRDILKGVAAQGGYTPENNYNDLDVTAVDNWSVTVFRWLTPVRDNHQKMNYVFNIKNNDVIVTYADGPGSGDSFGVADGKTFKVTRGLRREKYFHDVATYCPHVRHYYLWPYILAQMPLVAYIGKDSLNDQTYDLVFAGFSTRKANTKEDQYILWVNPQSKQVDYVEFTIRDLLSSLRGVVAYKDYRDAGGVRFAYDINLLNDIHSQGSAHHLVAQSIELHR